MMAGNPNWWSMNSMHPPDSSPFVYPSNPSPPPSDDHRPSDGQDFPVRSWSQLVLGGGDDDDRYGGGLFQQQKKLENWEDQVLNMNPSSIPRVSDVKQESCYGVRGEDEFPAAGVSNCSWPPPPPPPPSAMPVSSPTSCITNNILNFSSAKTSQQHNQEHSSESTSGGISNKKARVQQSSAQPALKVRKEKLGDRITALHQLVSPFGKTDTASVLSEAIGYIRFLQGQIEALSSPYMRNTAAGSTGHHQHSFLNDIRMERGSSKQGSEGEPSELRSRGLCLVPISCTQHMATDSGGCSGGGGSGGGTDYWPPVALGGGF